MVAGLCRAIRQSGSGDNLIVLSPGFDNGNGIFAQARSIRRTQISYRHPQRCRREPVGLARDVGADPDAQSIREVSTTSRFGDSFLRVSQSHDQVHIVSGRMPTPGLSEVIMGKGLVRTLPRVNLGSSLRFGSVLECGGNFEGRRQLFRIRSVGRCSQHSGRRQPRTGMFNSPVRLKNSHNQCRYRRPHQRIADDSRINLQAETETTTTGSNRRCESSGVFWGCGRGIMAFGAIFCRNEHHVRGVSGANDGKSHAARAWIPSAADPDFLSV